MGRRGWSLPAKGDGPDASGMTSARIAGSCGVLRAGLPRVWPRLQHPNVARAITYDRGTGSDPAHRHAAPPGGDAGRPAEPDGADRPHRGSSDRFGGARSVGRRRMPSAWSTVGSTPHSVFLTETDGAKVLDFGIPVALWTTAREAGEAVGDDDAALPLDRARDARESRAPHAADAHRRSGIGRVRSPKAHRVGPGESVRTPVSRSGTRPSARRAGADPSDGDRRAWAAPRGSGGAPRARGLGRARDSFIDAAIGRVVHPTPSGAIDPSFLSASVGLGRGRPAGGRVRSPASCACRDADHYAAQVEPVAAVIGTLDGDGRWCRTGRRLRTLVVGTGRGLRSRTHPVRSAGRHVVGATRAVAAAPRRAAPATGRLLRQATYPLVGAGAIIVAVVVGVGIFEGVPTSGCASNRPPRRTRGRRLRRRLRSPMACRAPDVSGRLADGGRCAPQRDRPVGRRRGAGGRSSRHGRRDRARRQTRSSIRRPRSCSSSGRHQTGWTTVPDGTESGCVSDRQLLQAACLTMQRDGQRDES